MMRPLLDPLLKQFIALNGSDLYLTVGCPPSVRVEDRIITLPGTALSDADLNGMVAELLDGEKLQEFQSTMEFNMPMPWSDSVRFRINVFRQQQHNGVVIRRIQTEIPTLETLQLPGVYSELIMQNRGLVLIAGATGSGKTSSLAAMVGYRNRHGYGHILTVEDPIEFVHKHGNCIVTQRDIGVDTYSMGMALKNALRQRPDVVVIGEIRDREAMEHALYFSETGHLCVATLHAGNTLQAIERVLHFFPPEKFNQTCYNLAYNLRGIVSQRLMLTTAGTRRVATEVMLNRGFIRSLIQENRLRDIPDIIAKNRSEGMQTFDQAIFQMFCDKLISEDVASAEADNPSTMRLLIRQQKSAQGPRSFEPPSILQETGKKQTF